MANDRELRNLVAGVAAAYFSSSHVGPAEIPTVIQQIATSLGAVGNKAAGPVEAPPAGELAPRRATPSQIKKSITPDALISFEDGKRYKTLKRHLSIKGLTLADYREKWGLPKDYPSVAPNYSAARSQMARTIGLGQSRSKAAGTEPHAPHEDVVAASTQGAP